MGFYAENTRVAPPPAEEFVPDKTAMFREFCRVMGKEISPDRRDADIMRMCVERRARTTHKEWVKTERGRVAGCWDMVEVSSDSSKIRWAK